VVGVILRRPTEAHSRSDWRLRERSPADRVRVR
jgi:hypothetical protein